MIDYDLRNVPPDWLDALKITPGEFEPGYTPVVALTITRQRRGHEREVLVTVRSDKNITHPGVLSVPTIKVRGTDALAWLPWCTNKLLTAKLCSNPSTYQPGWYSVWQGEPVIGTRQIEGAKVAITEKLSMINVHLPLGRDFPASTPDYSWIGYVDESKFLEATGARDATLLDVDLGTVTPVMYGMCVLSTAATLETIK